jgi:hypothetical protein
MWSVEEYTGDAWWIDYMVSSDTDGKRIYVSHPRFDPYGPDDVKKLAQRIADALNREDADAES